MTQGLGGVHLYEQVFMCFPAFSITFAGGPGRDGTIDFTSGSELLITKAKNGHLAVVSGTCYPGSKDQAVFELCVPLLPVACPGRPERGVA